MRQVRDDAEMDDSTLFTVSLPQAWKDPCFQNFFDGRFAVPTGNSLQPFHPFLDERGHMRMKYLVEQRLFPAEVIPYQSKMNACTRRYVTDGNLPETSRKPFVENNASAD